MKRIVILSLSFLFQSIAWSQSDSILFVEARDLYYGTDKVTKNTKKAFNMLESLYNKGYIRAGYLLSRCYALGKGTNIDEEKSNSIAKKCADAGDGLCQNVYAEYLMKTIKDEVEALDMFRKSYNNIKNNINYYGGDGLLLMGLQEYTGDGVPQNIALAGEHLKQAASLGNHLAKVALGGILFQNEKLEWAWGWIEDAANYYCEEALDFIGDNTKNDEEKYLMYLRAAKLGYAPSLRKLGYLYDNGSKGVPQSDKAAFKYYKMAAEKGDVYAMHNLGIYYRNGYYVNANAEEAKKWFRKAAAKGFANSIDYLRMYYRETMPTN